jgi:hypothetical protein
MPDLEGVDHFTQYPVSGEESMNEPAATQRVVINLNELAISEQIAKAKLPHSTKQMARRILALCVEKDSGSLWFNMTALRSLRRSPLLSDAYCALNRLQAKGIAVWWQEGDKVVVKLKAWKG